MTNTATETPRRNGVDVATLLRPRGLRATDLGVEWNLRRRRWPHLIDLDAVEELRDSEETPDEVRIGAALPLSDLMSRWPSAPPVIGEWLSLFASPLIRNRATLGGNLGTASPIGDSPPLLLALSASVELAGPRGRRILPLDKTACLIRRGAGHSSLSLHHAPASFHHLQVPAERSRVSVSLMLRSLPSGAFAVIIASVAHTQTPPLSVPPDSTRWDLQGQARWRSRTAGNACCSMAAPPCSRISRCAMASSTWT